MWVYRDNLFSHWYALVRVLTICIYYTRYFIHNGFMFTLIFVVFETLVFWVGDLAIYIFAWLINHLLFSYGN